MMGGVNWRIRAFASAADRAMGETAVAGGDAAVLAGAAGRHRSA